MKEDDEKEEWGSLKRYVSPEDLVGYWITPPKLYQDLNDEFHFDFDPCPYPRSPGFDGLKEDWGQSNYVNPPFGGGFIKWIRKGIEESRKGKRVVFIVPVMSWQAPLFDAGAEIRVLGRVAWLNPVTRKTRAMGNPIALFILDKKED